jgi:hypothetical protein
LSKPRNALATALQNITGAGGIEIRTYTRTIHRLAQLVA